MQAGQASLLLAENGGMKVRVSTLQWKQLIDRCVDVSLLDV